jgi:hypothetical protein
MLDLMDAAGLGDKNMDGTVRITTFLVKFPFANSGTPVLLELL